MNAQAKNKSSVQSRDNTLSNNVKFLYDTQWKQHASRGKTVYNYLNGITVSPKIETIEMVANRARIPVWYMFLPFEEEEITSLDLANLVDMFMGLDKEGRDYVLQAAKMATRK